MAMDARQGKLKYVTQTGTQTEYRKYSHRPSTEVCSPQQNVAISDGLRQQSSAAFSSLAINLSCLQLVWA